MEHERISALLSRTPAGVPSPEPDYRELAGRIKRRRARKLATASVVAAIATVGLVLPLSQLAGISPRSETGRMPPVPAAGGSTGTSTNEPSALPDTGSFACTANGTEVSTPEFAVQPTASTCTSTTPEPRGRS